MSALSARTIEGDFVAVIRGQGPRANGMPELHKLTPMLGSLQDAGFHVALVTDGRMSGASGKVPAAAAFLPRASRKVEIEKSHLPPIALIQRTLSNPEKI